MSERVKIYIDGGNTYRALFKPSIDRKGNQTTAVVPKGSKFAFKDFATFLATGRDICGKGYYIGIVRDHDHTVKSQEMVRNQQKFLANLENEGFLVERGKIVYDHTIREKGVDVKIAIDLVIDAIEDKYDTAILVSSDTDLIPAIRYVIGKGKKVEYIGFSSQSSLGLIRESTNQRILVKSDLEPFII